MPDLVVPRKSTLSMFDDDEDQGGPADMFGIPPAPIAAAAAASKPKRPDTIGKQVRAKLYHIFQTNTNLAMHFSTTPCKLAE